MIGHNITNGNDITKQRTLLGKRLIAIANGKRGFFAAGYGWAIWMQ